MSQDRRGAASRIYTVADGRRRRGAPRGPALNAEAMIKNCASVWRPANVDCGSTFPGERVEEGIESPGERAKE